MSDIIYAVMALKQDEVDSVMAPLHAEGLEAAASWLALSKAKFYGKRNDDWKPFGDKTIAEILGEDGGRAFRSATPLIDGIKDDLSNYADLVGSGIEIFFVDFFALFLPKYRQLADKLDLVLAEPSKMTCLALAFGISPDLDPLLSKYFAIYRAVQKAYLGGSLHRVALRHDDLRNFRNYLRRVLPTDRPDPTLGPALNSRLGQSKALPSLG